MYAVKTYAAVHRSVLVNGNSRREAARVFGINRPTLDKVCTYAAPPGSRNHSPVITFVLAHGSLGLFRWWGKTL
jgi:hypothetical protein